MDDTCYYANVKWTAVCFFFPFISLFKKKNKCNTDMQSYFTN